MSRRVIAVGVAVLAVAAAVAVVVAKRRVIEQLAPPGARPIPVRTATVHEGTVAEAIVTAALVEADTAATVAAQTPGVVLEMRLREGAAFRRGELLAVVDPRPLEDALESARARLAAAREAHGTQQAVFARDQALFEGGAIARQALDVSRAQLEAARAGAVTAERALATASVQRAYASVAAPWSGVVTARLAEPGDLASPGKPLYSVQREGGARLVSKLSQEALRRLAAGGDVAFSWEGQELSARTSRVYPALDALHLGTVETDLAAPPFGLPVGSTVEARYLGAPRTGLVVPAAALVEGLAETLVVTVHDGKARPVPVTVTARGVEGAIVGGSLRVGDVVVVGLPSELVALTAGTPVAPVGDTR